MTDKKPTTRIFFRDSISIQPLSTKLVAPGDIIKKGQSFATLAPKLSLNPESPEQPAPQQSEQPNKDK